MSYVAIRVVAIWTNPSHSGDVFITILSQGGPPLPRRHWKNRDCPRRAYDVLIGTVPFFPGGGGIRKLRWSIGGKGKSGGIRIIYYVYARDAKIYLLLPYKKSKQEDLTKEQLKMLRDYVKGGVL